MNIVIWVGISVDEVPSWLAFARTLVMRRVRVPFVPGGSTGTPSHVTEFAPEDTGLEHVRDAAGLEVDARTDSRALYNASRRGSAGNQVGRIRIIDDDERFTPCAAGIEAARNIRIQEHLDVNCRYLLSNWCCYTAGAVQDNITN